MMNVEIDAHDFDMGKGVRERFYRALTRGDAGYVFAGPWMRTRVRAIRQLMQYLGHLGDEELQLAAHTIQERVHLEERTIDVGFEKSVKRGSGFAPSKVT